MATRRTSAQLRDVRVDRSFLERKALGYLNRFDATVARLKAVLGRSVARNIPESERDARMQARQWIEEIAARYVESGLVNDRRFASNLARTLRDKGASRVKILAQLRTRGVDSAAAESVVREVDDDAGPHAELEAARAIVRRRRLGPYRDPAKRQALRNKDIATLARAGFSLRTALRALEAQADVEPWD